MRRRAITGSTREARRAGTSEAPGVETRVFTVLDSEDVLLGQVTVPERFRAVAVGTDVAFGVWRDQDDMPHVRA